MTAVRKGLAIFHISRTHCGILAVPSNAVFGTCRGITLTNVLKRPIQDLPCIQLATNWYSNVNYFTDSILLPQNYNTWSSSLCFVVALYVKSHKGQSYPSPTHSGADAHTIYLLCPSRSHHIIPNESFRQHCHVSSYTLFTRVWYTH